VRSPPNAAVRRFSAIAALSLAVKAAALAVLFLLVLRFVGGS
jgi:hypothetical protein